jgi:hypothetical protein
MEASLMTPHAHDNGATTGRFHDRSEIEHDSPLSLDISPKLRPDRFQVAFRLGASRNRPTPAHRHKVLGGKAEHLVGSAEDLLALELTITGPLTLIEFHLPCLGLVDELGETMSADNRKSRTSSGSIS